MGANLRTTSRYLTRQVSALTETSEESRGSNFGGTGYYTTHWTQNEAVWGNIWCHFSFWLKQTHRESTLGEATARRRRRRLPTGTTGSSRVRLKSSSIIASSSAAVFQSSSSVFRTSH